MAKLDPPVDSERGWQSANRFIEAQTLPIHTASMEMVQEHIRTEDKSYNRVFRSKSRL